LAGLLRFSISAFWPLLASSRWSPLISAVVPALKYSRSDLLHRIKSDSGRSSAVGHGFSSQAVTVVMQVAASVLLLVGAGF